MTRQKRFSILTVALAGLLALAPAAFAQHGPVGPPGGTIYAHDVAYRTVGTPAHLPDGGFFDTIYGLGEGFAAVSESAPGDMDYNGGRWALRLVTFVNIAPMQFTNADDIEAAAANGDITISEVMDHFECPLIMKR